MDNLARNLQDFDAEIFKNIAEQSPNMIFINQSGFLIYVNKKCTELLGYTREELCSPQFNFFDLIAPEYHELVKSEYQKHADGMEVPSHEYLLLTKAGRNIESIVTTKLIMFNGQWAILGIATDISSLKRVEKALRESEQNYRIILNSLNDSLYVLDQDLRFVFMNESYQRLAARLKLDYSSFMGRNILEIPSLDFLPRTFKTECERVLMTGETVITEQHVNVGKMDVYYQATKMPIYEGGTVRRVAIMVRDITDISLREKELQSLNEKLSKSNRKLKQLTLTDPHTNLYNHRFLSGTLEDEFTAAKKEATPLSLLMLDIDYFKSINDAYGHQFGDLVLKQFARELKKNVRRTNSITRYGGEEFVVLLPDTTRATAIFMAQRLLDTLNVTNFGDEKNVIKLKLSIAVASFPEDGVIKAGDLVELADHILIKAKEFGGNRVFSSQDLKNGKSPVAPKGETKADIKYMKEKIDRLNKRANQSVIEAVFAFARTIKLKDHYTGEHVERTVHFATKIAERLGLSKEELLLIKQAAILHDLGKVGISEKILLKPTQLTKKELKEIRAHPLIGVDIIRPIHLLHNILPLILYHHERWDGRGYPMGLKGEDIPVGARIISLADAYQALISDRPYRKAFPQKKALQIIREGAGTQFDPAIVEVFLKIAKK